MKDKGTVSEPDSNLQDRTSSHNWTPGAVKALRLRLRLSQEQFAERTGVQRGTVSSWENGHTWPTDVNASVLDALATGDTSATVPPAPDATAELRGRALEVSALLAYALERQNLLAAALYSPPERGSDAQAIAAADAPIPSAPAGAPRGARQRRHGTG